MTYMYYNSEGLAEEFDDPPDKGYDKCFLYLEDDLIYLYRHIVGQDVYGGVVDHIEVALSLMSYGYRLIEDTVLLEKPAALTRAVTHSEEGKGTLECVHRVICAYNNAEKYTIEL